MKLNDICNVLKHVFLTTLYNTCSTHYTSYLKEELWKLLHQGFFSKFSVPVGSKIRPFFCYFKHEIQLFKVLLSLKVKFDTKMYLNFSNFRGRTSAGGVGWGVGRQALVQKRGQVSDGGDWQNFRRMGRPPVPPEKTLLHHVHIFLIWV